MSAMTETEFHREVDATLQAIEQAVEQLVEREDEDIDFDRQGGVLTLDFAGRGKLIFSRQTPVRQLWLASPGGGFHFDWRDGGWQLPDGRTLSALLNQFARQLAGHALTLEF
jgi:CyaY protein